MTAASLPPVADPAQLTTALRQAGVLGTARVSDVSLISAIKKLRSHTFRLRLVCEGQASEVPASLILKTGHLDEAGRPAYANAREIAFYRDLASALPAGLVPHCYDAVEATQRASWHLLLEDLTDTHVIATEWPLPPAPEQCRQMIQTLARFHAAWWDDARLGVTVGHRGGEEVWLTKFAVVFDDFIARCGHLLPDERRHTYRRLMERAPALLAQDDARRNPTVTHGDAHAWNFFVPRSEHETARLLDWEGWALGKASDDLAYMMAMLWYPDRRRRLEQPLLDHYHAALMASGVSGYSRQALSEDYRLSALWLIMRPVWQAMAGIGAGVWWNNLERIFLAIDDLGCRELLD